MEVIMQESKRCHVQEEKGNSRNNLQPQKPSVASQAYRLFSEGKAPLEVAIELNLKESDATKYYREHWKLRQLHNLYLIHEDIGDDIIHLVKLHRRMRADGIGVEQAINLIKIANNDLHALEQKYQKLKRDVNSLESRKFEEYRTLNDLQDQIDCSERMLKWLKTSCEEEEAKINQLESQKIRLNMPDKERRQKFYPKPFDRLSLPIAISKNQAYPFKRVERIFVKTEF
jgi:hypothetical protein